MGQHISIKSRCESPFQSTNNGRVYKITPRENNILKLAVLDN